MSGEISATNVVIKNGVGVIVGQGEMTLAFNGTPIDVSNKSNGDFVTLLNGELSGKQLQVSGPFVYNDDTQFRKMRSDAITGTLDTYTITYLSPSVTDESFTALMMPNGLSDALPHGDKISTNITFLSSGPVTHVQAAAV